MKTAILTDPSPVMKSAADPFAGIDFFRLFAFCFGQPSNELFSWLSGSNSRSLWKQLGRHLGTDLKPTPQDQFSDYSTYEAAYIALFEVGVLEPPVPLLESAHSKRAVPQEIVLDCVNFYDVLGLRPLNTTFPADHLVTQLEFLAAVRFLRESEPRNGNEDSLRCLERDFIQRHLLRWLPIAQEKLLQLHPPLFPMLLSLLIAFLKREAPSDGGAPGAIVLESGRNMLL
jgi:TorA maturation chaperone TorD